ncbi:hypothetical protein GC163_07565 [bacterium]|nr:hypothetical protein [bacterium]
MRDITRSFAVGVAVLWACCFSWGTWELRADEPLPLPIEFQPYVVDFEIEIITADADTLLLQAELSQRLPETIERCIGSRWQLANAIQPSVLSEASVPADSEQESAEGSDSDVPESKAEEPIPVDVQYHIQISTVPGRITVEVSAMEPLWERRSPTLTIQTGDRRELPSRIVAAMHRLFRPRGLWERIDDEQVRLRVQGAAFATPDPELPLLNPVEVFTPWMVFYTREGTVQRLVPVPWTLLELNNSVEGSGLVTVYSGLAQPLGTSPRGRVKLFAVAERSQWETSELLLQTQSQPPQPLVAHRVELHREVVAGDDEPIATKSLITNRHGVVPLSRVEQQPWVWVTVTSGDQRLAEVPLVPGAERRIQLDVPDDRLRLRTEGELRLLQSELVASVAERQGLILAARAAGKKQAWNDVTALTQQLQQLPGADKFRDQLAGIRVSAVAQARQQQNRLAERRIVRMCDDTNALITRYLADDKVRLLLEELDELKAALTTDPPP